MNRWTQSEQAKYTSKPGTVGVFFLNVRCTFRHTKLTVPVFLIFLFDQFSNLKLFFERFSYLLEIYVEKCPYYSKLGNF